MVRHVFSCGFCEIFKSSFFHRTLSMANTVMNFLDCVGLSLLTLKLCLKRQRCSFHYYYLGWTCTITPLILYAFKNYAVIIIIFYLSFLSRTFTIHRTVGERGPIILTPLYHFHPLHRHLDIRRAITAESSPLHIASSRTRTANLCFPSKIHQPLSYAPSFFNAVSFKDSSVF